MSETYQGLYVKFGADTVEFDNSVKGMNKALTSLKKDISTLNKSLKLDPDNVDLLTQKLENFQEQARVGALKIQELKKQQEALGKENVGTAEWKALQQQIDKTEVQMLSVAKASEKTEKRIKDVGNPDSVYNLDKAIKEVKTDLDILDRKLKLDPGNIELSQQKMKLLEKQAQLSGKKITALKKEQAELGKEKINTSEWKKFESQIVDTQLEVQKLNSDIDDMGSNSATNSIEKKIDTSNLLQATDSLAQAGEKVLEFGKNTIDSFNEVDNAMDIIVAKTGEASDSYTQMVRNITQEVPLDNLDDVGSAIGEVRTQFGLTGKALENASVYLLKFSKINETDVTSSVVNSKKILEEFNLTVEDLPTVLDSLTSTAQNTGVGIDDLFSSIENNYTALQELDLTLPQSIELLGQLGKSGIDSSKVLKAMSKATSVYASEGKSLSSGLEETANKIQNAKNKQDGINEAVRVFGTKQGPLMAKLLRENKLDFQELGTVAQSSVGKVGDTFEKQKDPIDELKVAQNQYKQSTGELGGELGTVLAPILEIIAKALERLSRVFSKLPAPVKTFIVLFGGLLTFAALLAPVLVSLSVAFGLLSPSLATAGGVAEGASVGFAALSTSLLPIIGIIAGVALAITGIVLLIKNWGTISKTVTNVAKNAWSAFTEFFSGIGEKIKSTIKKIGGFFTGLGSKLKKSMSNMWSNLKIIFARGVLTLIASVGNIKKKIADKFSGLKDAIKSKIGNMKEIGKAILNGILSGLTNFATAIKDKIVNGLRSAKKGIGSISSRIFGKSFGGSYGGVMPTMMKSVEMAKDSTMTNITNGGASTTLNISVTTNNDNAEEIARVIERNIVRRITI